MKSGQDHINTWFNRVRRIVSKAAHLPEENEQRWCPESFQAEQMEFASFREKPRLRRLA